MVGRGWIKRTMKSSKTIHFPSIPSSSFASVSSTTTHFPARDCNSALRDLIELEISAYTGSAFFFALPVPCGLEASSIETKMMSRYLIASYQLYAVYQTNKTHFDNQVDIVDNLPSRPGIPINSIFDFASAISSTLAHIQPHR